MTDILDLFLNLYVFMSGSCVVDNIGTTLNCSLNGSQREANPIVRKNIEKKGAIKGCLYELPLDLIIGISGVAICQGIDYLLGGHDFSINLTKVAVYGIGGFKYLCGISHLLEAVVGPIN